ncbi:MAG: hypothetical protein EBR54_07900 [Flavobacteriia bacterium]|nr:hypothetical protein [Flavobacteriia bacterium]
MKKFHLLVVFWLLHSGFFAQGKRIKWENFNNRSNWKIRAVMRAIFRFNPTISSSVNGSSLFF